MQGIKALGLIVVGLIALLFAGAMMIGTTTRPAPDVVPGYLIAPIPVDHRDGPVELHIWYPTDATRDASLAGQNALFYGFYTQPGAMARDGSPVIALSHGSGGNAVQLGWLATHLARSGFIVVTPNHPGTTSGDSDPNQTVQIWQRPLDLKAALDYVANAGIGADMDRVGVLGFSLGGFSALSLAGVQVSKAKFIEYCATYPDLADCGWLNKAGVDFDAIDAVKYERSNLDRRVNAVVAVDPALSLAMVPDSLALDAKALVVNLGAPDTMPPGMRADQVGPQLGTYQIIDNTSHFAFLAECSLLGQIVIGLAGDDNICADQGGRDRSDVHEELREVIATFFKRNLAG